MGCLKLNDEYYEGVIIDMGKSKKNKNQRSNKSLETNKNLYIPIPAWLAGILLTVLFAILGWCAKTIHNVDKNSLTKDDIGKLEDDIGKLEDDIGKLEDDIAEINLWIQGDKNDKAKPGASYRLNKIEEKLNIASISISDNNIEFVAFALKTDNNEEPKNPPNSETYLGADSEGNKYNFGDVINETILLTYNENGKEVYFLGQLNENFHWNGYCITNTYNANGTLYGICESNFEDGKRIDYKSFYESDTNNEWILTNRKCTNEGNLGTSICYNFEYDKIKNFTNTNVRVYDILYVDDFNNPEGKTMLYYYHGLTSDGVYNDKSGSAYYISFYSDGTVENLYVGNFENGEFKDDDAWEISYVERLGYYVLNTGEFISNHALNQSGEKKSIEQIQDIISSYSFDCELRWKQ